jgi:Mitochondrial protein Pet127
MRAQLDAQDPRLPGSGVFDIKTRATVAIRYDPLNYKVSHRDMQEGCGTNCSIQKNVGYLIKTTQGALESFEREHYDLIRAAFLKYV